VKKALVAAAAAVVVVVAVIAVVPILERHVAQAIKTEIERDGVTKVGAVEVGLFDRSIVITGFKSSANGTEQAFARWQVSGLAWPWGEVLRGHTPLRGVRLGDPLQADRIEFQDMKLVDGNDGTRVTLQGLVVEGFDLARFDPAYQGAFPFQVWTARALGALGMRRLEATNLAMAAATGDTINVGRATVERYEQGRIGMLTLDGLATSTAGEPAALFKVDRLVAAGLDSNRLLAAMSAADWYPGAPVGRVHLDHASASGFGGDMLSRYGLSLGSVSMETTRESDKVSRSRTRILGFMLAPPRGLQGLQTRLALQTMGLKEVKLDLDCAGTEDRGKGQFVFGPCKLVGPGLLQIDFTARIIDADGPFWRAIDDGDMPALNGSKAGFDSAKLVVADKSLLERGLKALAVMTGRPVSETRANLAREVRLYQPSDVLISQDMTKLLDTVARFIEQGGTLTIDAAPQPPLDLEQLRGVLRPGADLVRLLGLSASLSR
jgi:hypothetical protein